MKRPQQFLIKLPEYLLIGAVVFYWGSSGMLMNPIAIGLFVLLVLQIIFKNKISGLIIAGLLIIGSMYMLLAVMSEFNEFPTFNAGAKKLLFVGLSLFISIIIVSGIMIFKYAIKRETTKYQTLSGSQES